MLKAWTQWVIFHISEGMTIGTKWGFLFSKYNQSSHGITVSWLKSPFVANYTYQQNRTKSLFSSPFIMKISIE